MSNSSRIGYTERLRKSLGAAHESGLIHPSRISNPALQKNVNISNSILDLCNCEEGKNVKELCNDLESLENTIRKYLVILVELGYLSYDRPGRENRYYYLQG
ncbi:MAG: hypothetical protein QNJ51_03105 [Calothrix sp. MO_167.B12]|nr:hypothetical protein [Calothrix sp. MO_167.B12]